MRGNVEIKVLHIISGNDNGGGGQHVLNICSANDKVFENYLCCIGQGPLFEKSKFINISKYYLANIKDRKIFEIIKNEKIDLINFHGPKANFIHLYYRKKFKIPCVTTIHSDFRYDFLNNKIKYILYTPLNILALRGFRSFVCVSDSLKMLLNEKRFKGEMAVICNGIDTEKIKINRDPKQIRGELGIIEDEFVYIMVARMHPVKNHINLIKAFEILKKDIKKVKLILVGDGVLLDEIKNLISEFNIDKDVILTGQRDDSIDFVNAADISMLTSLSEGGIPTLSFLESAAVKKTIICSDIGSFNQILTGDKGYLINPDSVENIYEKMKEAYIDKDKLPLMGQKLYSYVCDNYSIEKFTGKYYEFYKNIINQ